MKSFADIVEPYLKSLEKVDWATYKNKPMSDGSSDLYLFMKWAYRVEKGWYGFAVGNVPMPWVLIIDKFLRELEVEAPDFKIHQIKLKFGGLRFYVDLGLNDALKVEAIQHEIAKLQKLLYNEHLVY